MKEWELIERLQTIKHKLDNNIELTDVEYKLFTLLMFTTIMGIFKWSLELVSKSMVIDLIKDL